MTYLNVGSLLHSSHHLISFPLVSYFSDHFFATYLFSLPSSCLFSSCLLSSCLLSPCLLSPSVLSFSPLVSLPPSPPLLFCLLGCHGVMVGRAIVNSPFYWGNTDSNLYQTDNIGTLRSDAIRYEALAHSFCCLCLCQSRLRIAFIVHMLLLQLSL